MACATDMGINVAKGLEVKERIVLLPMWIGICSCLKMASFIITNFVSVCSSIDGGIN